MKENQKRLMIVTGSSAGLGQATVKLALESGWQVLGIARRAVDFGSSNYKHLEFDLSETQDLEESLSRLLEPFGNGKVWDHLVIVNNAAILGDICPLNRLSESDLTRTFKINVVAPVMLTSSVLRMISFKRCAVVDISSGAAQHGYAGMGAYCSSKAALHMLSDITSIENKDRNVWVMSYQPGVLDTEMQTQVRHSHKQDLPQVGKFKDLYETGKLTAPEDSARFLLDRVLEAPNTGFETVRFG